MPYSGPEDVTIQERWLLANVPFVSFFCENDALYTMRFLTVGGGEAFGYDVNDFIDNKHYFAASTTHPEDLDIVDAHAEQAAAGGRPVVSRYRLVQADGEPVQVLMASQAVRNPNGETIGLAGCCVDLRVAPELQGDFGLLSELRVPGLKRAPVNLPVQLDAASVAPELPMLSYYAENDPEYTVRASFGSMEELLGYTREAFQATGEYRPASAVHPGDQDIADRNVECAAQAVGNVSCARMRLIHSSGEPVTVLAFNRGAQPEGSRQVGVAGGVLDISHVPALHGTFAVLTGE